jgi:hypothetical protein
MGGNSSKLDQQAQQRGLRALLTSWVLGLLNLCAARWSLARGSGGQGSRQLCTRVEGGIASFFSASRQHAGLTQGEMQRPAPKERLEGDRRRRAGKAAVIAAGAKQVAAAVSRIELCSSCQQRSSACSRWAERHKRAAVLPR